MSTVRKTLGTTNHDHLGNGNSTLKGCSSVSLQPFVITGIHRSGTTWLGGLFASLEVGSLLHEPLNMDHGVVGVPIWYPYHPGGEPLKIEAPFAQEVELLYSDFFAGRSRYIRQLNEATFFRSLLRRLFGSSMERNYRELQIKQAKERVLLKDPFALFTLPLLAERYSAKAVIITRHPGAIAVSMRRAGWKPVLSDLRAQPGLLTSLGVDIRYLSDILLMSDVAQNAFFWNLSYSWASFVESKYPGSFLIVRHEDLVSKVEPVLRRMLIHFGLIDRLPSALAYIERTTNGKAVVPVEAPFGLQERNGDDLINGWKTQLTLGEKADLMKFAGPNLLHLYPF